MNSNVEAFFPLAPMQQGILFHTLYTPGTPAYFQQVDCTLRGPLGVPAFRQAWRRVCGRHAALRTSFVWEDIKEPIQLVHRHAELPFDERDWRGDAPALRDARWEDLLREDRERGFDLSAAPLLRLALARVDESVYRFAVSYHHIILDGWSVPVLLKEAFTYYEALGEGREPALEEPPRFRDYVAWLRRQDLAAAQTYWRRALAGFAAPTTLGSGAGRPDAPPATEEQFAEQRAELPGAVADALQTLARGQRLTPSTLFYGAWGLLLSRYTGEQDVLFGATVSGRMAGLPGIEKMVGLLVNTLPVRVRVDEEAGLLDWLKRLQARQVEARQYEYSPLAEVQNWGEVPRGQSLFDALVVFENYPVDAGAAPGGLSVGHVRTFERTNYPLTLLVGSRPASTLRLIYDTRHFSHDTIARMLGHLRRVLESVAAEPETKLSEVRMLTEAERSQLLTEWNDAATADEGDEGGPCLHQLFESQAARTPDAVAVVDGEAHLTYRELDARAGLLAARLSRLGAGPETTVGVCLKRSPELVAGLLGVLKTGGAYVPLDPDYPRERFAFMLADSRALLLLTEPSLAPLAETAGVPVVYVDGARGDATAREEATTPGGATTITRDDAREVPRDNAKELPGGGARGANLAYVIYTSGSTGVPKGTAIEHRQAVAFLRWAGEAFTAEEKSRVLASTSVCFDLSIFELFLPLTCGGAVVMAQTGLALPALPSASAVTLVNTVPSVLGELLKLGALPASVRTVNLAGEPLKSQLVRDAYAQPPVRRVYNLYGPSEDTTYSTFALLERDSDEAPPIGRPVTGTQAHLLDRAGRLVPVGVTGEIHLGGRGLARGYLNRPDLTAERFVPDAFGGLAGRRLYQTGDLARRRGDGSIEFLGRMDHQVKLRGFRIELGEVEVALCRHPSVREAVVAAREGRAGEKQLVAYVVREPNRDDATAQSLRDFLRERLPAYMTPHAFMFLEGLPLTPNKKIDRRRLPAVEPESGGAATAYVAPRTDIERRITEVWREVLSLPKVGIHDNFFDLGGHSLLLLAAYARLRNGFGRDLSMVELFKHPTIAALSEYLAGGTGVQPHLHARQEPAPSRRDSMNRLKDFRGRRLAARELGELRDE